MSPPKKRYSTTFACRSWLVVFQWFESLLLCGLRPVVQGQSLRDRLDAERQLRVTDAVRIAREVAGALDRARRLSMVASGIAYPRRVCPKREGTAKSLASSRVTAGAGARRRANCAASRQDECGMDGVDSGGKIQALVAPRQDDDGRLRSPETRPVVAGPSTAIHAQAGSAMFRLRTFGGLVLERDGAPHTGPATQRRRLALLALLAAGKSGVSRERLMSQLWPDSDPARARHSLDDALSAIRRDLRSDTVFLGVGTLRLDPDVLACDLAEYAAALQCGDVERAVALYAGPFLDGFVVPDAADFDMWMELERARRTREHLRTLDALAEHAPLCGRYRTDRLTRPWRRLGRLEERIEVGAGQGELSQRAVRRGTLHEGRGYGPGTPCQCRHHTSYGNG